MFSKHVKLTTELLIGNIISGVEEWGPEQLEVPECVEGWEDLMFKEVERDATIIVTKKSPERRFKSVQSSWFRQCSGSGAKFYMAAISQKLRLTGKILQKSEKRTTKNLHKAQCLKMEKVVL